MKPKLLLILALFLILKNARADESINMDTSRVHHLSEVAERLGALNPSDYLVIQERWVGSREAACNSFVTAAMCEDGMCSKSVPKYTADAFGPYLIKSGWTKIDLPKLKELFEAHADFDVIAQRTYDPHGHILIPIGVAADGSLVVAEGELDGVSNEITEETDQYMDDYEGGLTIFIRQ